MAIYDLYSKRERKMLGEVCDVYIYDKIPHPLRVQIVHIWHDTIGSSSQYGSCDGFRNDCVNVVLAYQYLVKTLCREYGTFRLIKDKDYGKRNYLSELVSFLLQEEDTEKILDAIELSFWYVDAFTRRYDFLNRQDASKRADKAIEELNGRFQEHGIGFQFTDGKIIRTDSKLIHAEVVKPALMLLHGSEYAGAQAEFLKAHEHYRHGNAKETLSESLKALESIMKAICDKRGWEYQSNATCKSLIQICIDKCLIPNFWMQHFSSLRSTLETGVPPARNKLGGHGQGSSIVDVPLHIVAYVLHMTAACIVFLVESEHNLP